MTLCDPFAINFLSQSAMKLVNHQVRAARGRTTIGHVLVKDIPVFQQ
jgi:hypothetical protein